MLDLESIKKDLKARLSKHRFEHTQSVAGTAITFAKAISNNPKYKSELTDEYLKKIELAGWLHDSCKELKANELLELAEFYGIEIYDEDRQSPNTLHARVGAAWIEEEYDILDPAILLAVRDHTLGSINMLSSAKIVYLADMLEPGRDAKDKSPELERLRKLIFEEHDLDKALLEAMDTKIRDVIEGHKPIHPLSVVSRNSLLKNVFG